MNKLRKLIFGKYKGEYILYIIAIHIGYIIWCLDNTKNFKLNDIEQKYYDWTAIGIIKYNLPMTFPVDLMCEYVKDKDSLKSLNTPLIWDGYTFYSKINDKEIFDLLVKAGVVMKQPSLADLEGLNHSLWKDVEMAIDDGEDEDDIFGGWGGMYDVFGK